MSHEFYSYSLIVPELIKFEGLSVGILRNVQEVVSKKSLFEIINYDNPKLRYSTLSEPVREVCPDPPR